MSLMLPAYPAHLPSPDTVPANTTLAETLGVLARVKPHYFSVTFERPSDPPVRQQTRLGLLYNNHGRPGVDALPMLQSSPNTQTLLPLGRRRNSPSTSTNPSSSSLYTSRTFSFRLGFALHIAELDFGPGSPKSIRPSSSFLLVRLDPSLTSSPSCARVVYDRREPRASICGLSSPTLDPSGGALATVIESRHRLIPRRSPLWSSPQPTSTIHNLLPFSLHRHTRACSLIPSPSFHAPRNITPLSATLDV